MGNTVPRSHAIICVSTIGSVWSTCAPIMRPGTTTKVCRQPRSRRICAPIPGGSGPHGRLGGGGVEDELIHAGLDILNGTGGGRRRAPAAPPVPAELRQPLDALGLEWPLSLDDLKTRYKALAKRHHPDANGGDRGAEERLKTINLAYAALRTHLVSEPVAG
jgi:hypothetical protein